MLPYRYFVCTSDKHKDWEDASLQYRANLIDIDSPADILKQTASELTLEEQFKLISSLSNYHKWQWNENEEGRLVNEQKFFCVSRRYPVSPRNQIIQACCFDMILTILFMIVYSILLLVLH